MRPHDALQMSVKVHVIFYSMYGHVFKMAEAVSSGAQTIPGVKVNLFQVPELVPQEILIQSGASKAREAFAHVPIVTLADLDNADALIFGTPTRFGNMCSQMRNFLDQTGGLWARGALAGKIASVFISTASQHGGQETTITSFHNTLFHHGMIVLGAPIWEKRISTMDEITGGSPYGASTLAGPDGRSRRPTENELAIARSQGRYVAQTAVQLTLGRHELASVERASDRVALDNP